MDKKARARYGGGIKSWQLWVAVLFIVLAILGANFYSAGVPAVGSLKDKESSTGAVSLANCPTDGDTSLTIDVQNLLNTSGSETFDTTLYVLDSEGGIVTSITDTTSPSASTITCGYEYSLKVVSADADGGDNSQIASILAQPSGLGAKVESGMVSFKADRSNINLKLGVEQHGVLTFKVYDNEDARYAYDTADADNTVFEADGTTFTDGDNATAFVVGANGYVDFTVYVKGGDDTDFEDAYVLVALELPVTEWDKPSVNYDGLTLTDVKTNGLTADETVALNTYEYVYKVDKDMLADIHKLNFYVESISGVNPSTDIQIDFFSAGNYLKTSGTGIGVGTHKDDSSKTVVFTVQDVTVDIS